MNYKLLNEVLIEWNESFFEDSDNTFLKSEDIKKSLDRCFVYRLDEKEQIKIFGDGTSYGWPQFKKYKKKIRINGKHVELNNHGYTISIFKPGEYKIYIEDIDKVTDIESMFFSCQQLVSAFIPDSVTSIGDRAFCGCRNLKTVYVEDINKFNQIKFKDKTADPRYYGAKVIELKK